MYIFIDLWKKLEEILWGLLCQIFRKNKTTQSLVWLSFIKIFHYKNLSFFSHVVVVSFPGFFLIYSYDSFVPLYFKINYFAGFIPYHVTVFVSLRFMPFAAFLNDTVCVMYLYENIILLLRYHLQFLLSSIIYF